MRLLLSSCLLLISLGAKIVNYLREVNMWVLFVVLIVVWPTDDVLAYLLCSSVPCLLFVLFVCTFIILLHVFVHVCMCGCFRAVARVASWCHPGCHLVVLARRTRQRLSMTVVQTSLSAVFLGLDSAEWLPAFGVDPGRDVATLDFNLAHANSTLLNQIAYRAFNHSLHI